MIAFTTYMNSYQFRLEKPFRMTLGETRNINVKVSKEDDSPLIKEVNYSVYYEREFVSEGDMELDDVNDILFFSFTPDRNGVYSVDLTFKIKDETLIKKFNITVE